QYKKILEGRRLDSDRELRELKMHWRLARGVVLVVAASIAMWPMIASAIAGDETRGGASGQPVGQHRRAQYFYVPAAGTHGHGPDPDTWDFATKSGYFRVVLDGSGTSEEAPPDAEPSNCVPAAAKRRRSRTCRRGGSRPIRAAPTN